MSYKISWWKTSFGNNEIKKVVSSIKQKNISQGHVTNIFEKRLSKYLKVKHVVALTNGSSAIAVALLALGIKPGDEVILPNRTWIATAHAVSLIGAKVVVVEAEPFLPLIDISKIEKKITKKTKAIIVVNINGRFVNTIRLRKIKKKYNLSIIEDSAQAIGSKNKSKFVGTQSDIGCFSLSVAKTISTAQGGFTVTNNKKLARRMRLIRTQGVANVLNPKKWNILGFNFKFNDILASIGIEQLKLINRRVKKLKVIYSLYEKGLKGTPFRTIPVNLKKGEVPVYNEFLVKKRDQWINKLSKKGVETRPFNPDICQAGYLFHTNRNKIKPSIYQREGIYLPSGPSQKLSDIKRCINIIRDTIL